MENFKNLSKAQLMELLAKKDSELEMLAKNQKSIKKAKFDNIIIIRSIFAELLNYDDGAYSELKNQLALLNSIGDKWNYVAYGLKLIEFIIDNNIDIKKIDPKKFYKNDEHAYHKIATSDIIPKIKSIFNDLMQIEKNIAVPKKPEGYNSINA